MNKRSVLCAAILSSTLINPSFANVDDAQGVAVEILSQVQDNSQVIYVNAMDWVQADNDANIPSLSEIKKDVIQNNKRYLLDFSSIEDSAQLADAKSFLRSEIGISFNSDLLIISEHKGELLFIPLEDEDDINISELEPSATQDSERTSNDETLPHVSFYLRAHRQITQEECTFRNSNLWNHGTRNFCNNPHISLTYRVVLERSLQFGVTGSATPDAKIVRISLDEQTSGAAIHLNDSLSYKSYERDHIVDGYFKNWSTSAIAQDYKFVISADNDKTRVLKSFPENINTNYENKETESFTLGVSGSAEADKAGPKGKLEANGSYTQTNWLSFNTQDYAVTRNSQGFQNVSFTWQREQYATAESLLNRSTDADWVDVFPADLSRVRPLSYTSFVPNMDVIFEADADETGSTSYTIDSSVNIRPIYHGAYTHYIVFGYWTSYHGWDYPDGNHRASKKVEFTVDWEHPVFTGGRPVNLQLGSFNSLCVQASEDNSISTKECDKTKTSQSFIYDSDGRYVSAMNTRLCLDGTDLSALQACNQNLSQRWEWVDETDKLQNQFYTNSYLGHNKHTGELTLSGDENNEVSLRTLTIYTDVFHKNPNAPEEFYEISATQNGNAINLTMPEALYDSKNRIMIRNQDHQYIAETYNGHSYYDNSTSRKNGYVTLSVDRNKFSSNLLEVLLVTGGPGTQPYDVIASRNLSF